MPTIYSAAVTAENESGTKNTAIKARAALTYNVTETPTTYTITPTLGTFQYYITKAVSAHNYDCAIQAWFGDDWNNRTSLYASSHSNEGKALSTLNKWTDCPRDASPVNEAVTITKTKSTQTLKVGLSTEFESMVWFAGYYYVNYFDYGTNTTRAEIPRPFATISIPAKANYAVTYNANGGSGAPANQTKWYGESLALSSTIPARTGYDFAGWATSSDGPVAYAPGSAYTANAALTLYAVWSAHSYTVSFNANFPDNATSKTGSMEEQDFFYGVAQNLPSNTYVAGEYAFAGWATSPNGMVVYSDGATVNNLSPADGATVTLYAIWRLNHPAPTLSTLYVYRCNADGGSSDDGTYASIEVAWLINAPNWSGGTMEVRYKLTSETNWAILSYELEGTSGLFSKIIGTFATDSSYDVVVCFQDEFGASVTSSAVLDQAFFTMDFLAGGHGIAFGCPSAKLGFECDMNTWFKKEAYFISKAYFDSQLVTDSNYVIRDSRYTDSGTLTTDGIYKNGLNFVDAVGYTNSYIEQTVGKDGTIGLSLRLQKHIAGGTTKNVSVLSGYINNSGTISYSLGDNVAFKKAASAMGAINANGYYGLARPDNNASDWIRTTSSGLIPYSAGKPGSGSLGTDSWRFNQAHIQNIYRAGSLISDHIVAQGTSGIWTYIKWGSKKFICWTTSPVAWTPASTVTTGKEYSVDRSLPFTAANTTYNVFIRGTNSGGGFTRKNFIAKNKTTTKFTEFVYVESYGNGTSSNTSADWKDFSASILVTGTYA